MPVLYLIDGNSYIYRAFYAIRGLATSTGMPTNAIYGFTNMILKILRERKPDYFAIVFDAPGPTHRHETYEKYKAHRPGMPDELRMQVPRIHEIVDALGIPSIEKPGFEADDILAALAREGESQGMEVFIVTGDKDMCQVVSPSVKLYDSMKEKVTEEKDVKERYGIEPARFPEIIALMGDASDNIPGAPGIGEKTAVKLLREFGSIDSLIENREKIKNARARKAVSENIDNIRLSLDLATVHPDIPLDIGVKDLKPGEPDWGRLIEHFREFEFTSLIKMIPGQEEMHAGRGAEYITVTDISVLETVVDSIKDGFAIDTETTSINPLTADLVGISVSSEKAKAFYIPLAHDYSEAPPQLGADAVLKRLRGILEDPGIEKTGHNIKYDLLVLRRAGIDMKGINFDTMIASYLLNPNRSGHGLDAIAMEMLGIRKTSYGELTDNGRKSFSKVSIEDATAYSGSDAAVTYELREILESHIKEEGLDSLFHEVEMPLVEVLADMETAGMKIDTELMEKYSLQLEAEMKSIEQRIYFLAGEEFNINSPKQLQEVLFDRLGLKPTKKTKTGYSTNIDVLEQLALEHELPGEIIEFRALSKLRNTYLDALPRMVNPDTGRLHTSFNQTITATGRLSSSDPNLQNIPVRGDWGRKIREAFIADEGNLLLSSDYSQIELRILAHLSGDELLVETFRQDGDIHTRTACELFGVKPEEVTAEMRRTAKTVNFGIIYGISPFGLSRQLRIPAEEARHYIDTYFARHSGVKEYMDRVIHDGTGKGYVTTIMGRKRPVPELRSRNRNTRQLGERLAINSPVQGSAADIIKVSMIRISRRIKEECLRARMLLQVHDELLFEVPEDEKDRMIELVRSEMEGAVELGVPMKVDIGTGNNWAEAH